VILIALANLLIKVEVLHGLKLDTLRKLNFYL